MDEIASNAISTDASSQIDILLKTNTNKTELNIQLPNVEDALNVLVANTEKAYKENELVFSFEERVSSLDGSVFKERKRKTQMRILFGSG